MVRFTADRRPRLRLDKRNTPLIETAAMVALACSSQAHAGEWKFLPSLNLAETYTDNLRLTPPGTEKGDFVTQVSPSISVLGIGRSSHFKADYVMQNLAYANERSGITTNHQLNAVADAELLRELFFLDGKAAINQQNISAFGPQPANNLNITDNRTDVKAWSVSPYLQRRFGQEATAQLRYAYEGTDTNSSSLQNARTDRVQFKIESGPVFKTLAWGVRYSRQKTNYSSVMPLDMEETGLNLNYRVSARLSLTGSAGYESNNYVSLGGENPSGRFWSAGVVWTPTERTSISATAGRRFYGDSYSLALSERTRNSIWSVGYHEDITTTQAQFQMPVTIDTANFLNQLWKNSIPNDETRAQAVDAFIRNTGLPSSLAQAVNTFTNRVFLQKSAQASVAVTGVKNTVVVSLFNMRREAQSTQGIDNALLGAGAATLADNTQQLGANAVWNWRLSPRINANLGGTYARVNALSTGDIEHNKSVRLAFVRKFQPKLTGTLELRRLQHDTNHGAGDFQENAITASLLMAF
jgi:uncharacterized protein (PEP-CTERM system associated)